MDEAVKHALANARLEGIILDDPKFIDLLHDVASGKVSGNSAVAIIMED